MTLCLKKAKKIRKIETKPEECNCFILFMLLLSVCFAFLRHDWLQTPHPPTLTLGWLGASLHSAFSAAMQCFAESACVDEPSSGLSLSLCVCGAHLLSKVVCGHVLWHVCRRQRVTCGDQFSPSTARS